MALVKERGEETGRGEDSSFWIFEGEAKHQSLFRVIFGFSRFFP